MRAHCSKMSNFLAYGIFDGVGFEVINAKNSILALIAPLIRML